MTDLHQCPQCGTRLYESTSPEGLCPVCLIQQALVEFPTTDGEQQATETAEAADAYSPPRSIGPYRLLQKLGEGGMGEVWAAEQSEPVRRKVALKLIKRGMDTKQVIARFESERQALALMDHPAIAHVFDAGETKNGRPYFAMELVRGVPITEHCDRHRLNTEDRLKLFMRVCEGVQHAHQKGIIHRDLKPSNVLVTIDGERIEPKIIDFGVAKATEQRLTEKTMFTELGVLVGTPEYMSPEQADLTAQDIDTRTDVYSLGALLYQLLAGALPFDSKELRRAGYEEIRRRIREDDPPKPSTRLSTLAGEKSTEAAKARRTDLSSLQRQLRGDLDWISMKALEKDRTRRYASPNELAADVRRHLQYEPVLAGPPSAAYRARKFVRRHRTWVGFAAVLLLVLIGFAVTMTVQAGRIARERDRANDAANRANDEADTANRVSEFMVRLFEIPDPGEARGDTITAREILDRGSEQIARGLRDEPLVRARLLATMGVTYNSLGLAEHALGLLEEALTIREQILPPGDLVIAANLWDLGLTSYTLRDFEKAKEHWKQCLAIRRKLLEPDDPDLASVLAGLGFVSMGAGDTITVESSEYYEQAEAAWEAYLRTAPDTTDWRAAESLALLGAWHARRGNQGKARDHAERAMAIFERIEESAGYLPLLFLNQIAETYLLLGDLDQAHELNARAVERDQEVFGPDHWIVAHDLANLAHVLSLWGRYGEAVPLLERALPIRLEFFGPDHERTYNLRRGLAIALTGVGDIEKARPHYGRVIELNTRLDRIGWLEDSVLLAKLIRDAGEHDDARRLYEDVIDRAERQDDQQLVPALLGYAELLRRIGRGEEAAVQEARAAAVADRATP